MVQHLNYHHLVYFRAVARDGNLTRAARELRVAPSAVSAQIRQLEDQLGAALFDRVGRTLELTEQGRAALAYADAIVDAGNELVSTFTGGRSATSPLRVGAVATLSRNFQRLFLRPALQSPDATLQLVAAGADELLTALREHRLDVVLSNRPAVDAQLRSHELARQPASLVSRHDWPRFDWPQSLQGAPLIVPGRSSALRLDFDAVCERLGVHGRVVAEVDDMATIRLLARDTDALALVPSVVVRDELNDGVLREVCVVPDLAEVFYAIVAPRRLEHPLVARLLRRPPAELLGQWIS